MTKTTTLRKPSGAASTVWRECPPRLRLPRLVEVAFPRMGMAVSGVMKLFVATERDLAWGFAFHCGTLPLLQIHSLQLSTWV